MSVPGSHQRGEIVLDCLHKAVFTVPLPSVGEQAYCRLCADYRTVYVSGDTFYAKCNTGRCRLNKGHGANKDAALATARKHVQKYTRHKVTILNGLLSVAEVTNTEETLFATAESRNAVADHNQKLLRNFALGATAKPDGMG